MSILIAPTTSAVSASAATQFIVRSSIPVTLSATALGGSEEVDITYSADKGVTWTTAYNFDTGTALVLTATAPQVELSGVGYYRAAKDATASSCSVHILS